MAETTGIAWANSTFNPWIGCAKVSLGCKNCYAEQMDIDRFSKTVGGATKENPISHWGKGAPRYRTSASRWKNPIKWNANAMAELSSFRNNPHQARFNNIPPTRPRVFPSLCDWLDEEVPIDLFCDFLNLIHDTPNLDWLLLTKRPELWRQRLQKILNCQMATGGLNHTEAFFVWLENWLWEDGLEDVPDNVWIGVSVEDQQRADERIPKLLNIPSKVRFLSVEPLLSKIELWRTYPFLADGPKIHWVIVGGESGQARRDCGVDAIIDVAKQCKVAKIPCFVKQDAAFKPGQKGRIPDEVWALKQFPCL